MNEWKIWKEISLNIFRWFLQVHYPSPSNSVSWKAYLCGPPQYLPSVLDSVNRGQIRVRRKGSGWPWADCIPSLKVSARACSIQPLCFLLSTTLGLSSGGRHLLLSFHITIPRSFSRLHLHLTLIVVLLLISLQTTYASLFLTGAGARLESTLFACK